MKIEFELKKFKFSLIFFKKYKYIFIWYKKEVNIFSHLEGKNHFS
jgi:hypothetical protein